MAPALCLSLYLLVLFASELTSSPGNVFPPRDKGGHWQLWVNIITSYESSVIFTK